MKKSSIGMHAIETSPGHVELVCDVSGRPHSRTTQFGMFCDSPDCECEKKSMVGFKDLSSFVSAAAQMFQPGAKVDENALMQAFIKIRK